MVHSVDGMVVPVGEAGPWQPVDAISTVNSSAPVSLDASDGTYIGQFEPSDNIYGFQQVRYQQQN